MRRTLATTLAATALSLGAARAADMSFKAPPPVAPPFSWAGFYAGANAGGAWDDSGFAADPGQYMLSPFAFRDNAGAFTGIPGILVFVPGTFPLPGRVAVGSNRGSFLGGVQVGYNWQFGTTVLGLEGQIDSLKASRSFTFTGPARTLTGVGTSVSESLTGAGAFERNIEGSFRGRLGRAWDRLLLYGTAGVAVTSLRTRGAFNSNLVLGPTLAPIPGSSLTGVNSASDISKTFIGPTIGFGAEYAIARNITVGAEYRHTFYGSEAVFPGMTPTVTFAAAGGSVTTLGSQVSGSYRLDTDEVMVRVNFLSN